MDHSHGPQGLHFVQAEGAHSELQVVAPNHHPPQDLHCYLRGLRREITLETSEGAVHSQWFHYTMLSQLRDSSHTSALIPVVAVRSLLVFKVILMLLFECYATLVEHWISVMIKCSMGNLYVGGHQVKACLTLFWRYFLIRLAHLQTTWQFSQCFNVEWTQWSTISYVPVFSYSQSCVEVYPSKMRAFLTASFWDIYYFSGDGRYSVYHFWLVLLLLLPCHLVQNPDQYGFAGPSSKLHSNWRFV